MMKILEGWIQSIHWMIISAISQAHVQKWIQILKMTLLEELFLWLPNNKGVALVQEAYKYGEELVFKVVRLEADV